MYEPMPGNMMWRLPTVMASEATTKNQPADMDIIMFQIRPGMAKGSSIFQNFCQPERRNTIAASSMSAGTVLSDW